MEALGKKLDKQNRENLSKEECDSIFLANTDILEDINKIKTNKTQEFGTHLEQIKQEALK